MRIAYAQGRYQNQMSIDSPYLRYVSILSENTRPTHAALHGKILPKNDPFWQTNYPPNDWHCRCKVQALTDEELKSKKLTPLADSSFLKPVASKDWAYNVGDTKDRYKEILQEKALKNFNCFKSNNAKGGNICDEVQKDIVAIAKSLIIFKAIKEMFKTSLEDARNSTKKIVIANATDEIKEAFNDDRLNEIYLSEWTIASHKHHKNITAFDYYLLGNILKKKALQIRQSARKEHLISYYYLNHYYRVVLKKTKENEIYIQSLVKGTKKLEKELR